MSDVALLFFVLLTIFYTGYQWGKLSTVHAIRMKALDHMMYEDDTIAGHLAYDRTLSITEEVGR